MRPDKRKRPVDMTGAPADRCGGDARIIPPAIVTITDLDAWAEHIRGRFMVEAGGDL